MQSLLIAVATTEQGNVSPHAGRALQWQVYVSTEKQREPSATWSLTLTDTGCLHEWHVREDNERHPLHNVDVAIAGSGGDGVKRRLAERNTELVETAQQDPLQAVRDYLSGILAPGLGHNEDQCLDPEHHKSRNS